MYFREFETCQQDAIKRLNNCFKTSWGVINVGLLHFLTYLEPYFPHYDYKFFWADSKSPQGSGKQLDEIQLYIYNFKFHIYCFMSDPGIDDKIIISIGGLSEDDSLDLIDAFSFAPITNIPKEIMDDFSLESLPEKKPTFIFSIDTLDLIEQLILELKDHLTS